MSKHIWNLKRKQIKFKISWSILATAPTYRPSTGICMLCSLEKNFHSQIWTPLSPQQKVRINEKMPSQGKIFALILVKINVQKHNVKIHKWILLHCSAVEDALFFNNFPKHSLQSANFNWKIYKSLPWRLFYKKRYVGNKWSKNV